MAAFSWPDYAVLGGYGLTVLCVGLWAGRRERDTQDYFLGGRRQHWLVACLSLLATEISALTFVTVPGLSFAGNCYYLQYFVGSFLARLAIAAFLLPAFYAGGVTTVYEYLGQRFGPWTRTAATLLFFVSRLIGSGYRLLACCLALSVVTGWPLESVIVATLLVVLGYTTFGGIKAVMFTDVLQALLVVGGPVVVAVFLVRQLGAGPGELWVTAAQAGKLRVFDFSLNPQSDKVFYPAAINAFFVTFAALGTDQALMQRLLTCPDLRRSRRSLLVQAVVAFPVVCLFLGTGVLLYLYYRQHADPSLPAVSDKVFPHFVVTVLPAGLKGLLIAGLLAASMGSLDSALQSLSTSAVVDLVRPTRLLRSDRAELRAARLFVVLFGLLLLGASIGFARSQRLEGLILQAFEMSSLVFGPMLGIFLLAVFTRHRGRDRANVLAMLSSAAALVVLRESQRHYEVSFVAWPWYVVIGTAWTYLLACLFRTRRAEDDFAHLPS